MSRKPDEGTEYELPEGWKLTYLPRHADNYSVYLEREDCAILVRLQPYNPRSSIWVAEPLSACCESTYMFDQGKIYCAVCEELMNISDTTVLRVFLPEDEASWLLSGGLLPWSYLLSPDALVGSILASSLTDVIFPARLMAQEHYAKAAKAARARRHCAPKGSNV